LALLALMAQAEVTTLPLKLTVPPLVPAASAEPNGSKAATPNVSNILLFTRVFIFLIP
jgi:hypothetical protein